MSSDSLKPYISVVVPVYNGSGFLSELCQRLDKVLKDMDVDYEVVLVDDSSTDGSFSIAQELTLRYKGFKAVGLAKNRGQQIATLVGISLASGEIIVTIDDDLQNPPEEIPLLVNPLMISDSLDATIARYDSKKHGLVRNIGTRALDYVSNYIANKPRDLHLTSFRAMRRHVARYLIRTHRANPRIGYLVLEATDHVINVQVHHEPRKSGSSGYSIIGLARDFWRIISENSNLTIYIIYLMRVLLAALLVAVLPGLVASSMDGGALIVPICALIAALHQFFCCLSERETLMRVVGGAGTEVPVVDTVAIRVGGREDAERA